jgi:hypothetical protein
LGLTNTIIEGALPSALGKCSLLEEVWLYGNDLSGTIPTEMGNFSRLADLSISDNPKMFGIVPTGDIANTKITGSVLGEICDNGGSIIVGHECSHTKSNSGTGGITVNGAAAICGEYPNCPCCDFPSEI